MKKTLLVLAIFGSTSILTTATSAYAQQASAFEKTIIQAQKRCPQLDCENSDVRVENMTADEIRDLGKERRARIRTAMVTLAREVWPDTILEGPFENLDRYRIDRVQRLLVNNKAAGYRVEFSDKAWDTETCDYNPEKPETLKKCDSGRIFDAGFTDLESRNTFRDEEVEQEFVLDKDLAVIQPLLF